MTRPHGIAGYSDSVSLGFCDVLGLGYYASLYLGYRVGLSLSKYFKYRNIICNMSFRKSLRSLAIVE